MHTPAASSDPVALLVDLTDASGMVLDGSRLARCEGLHRQLRPQLPADYLAAMRRVFAGGGRMFAAELSDGVVGLAVWRLMENTMFGRFVYVDDLVTDATRRSQGVGAVMLHRCEAIAIDQRCGELVLDSGVQRAAAHRFYFRHGLSVRAFNFGKPLAVDGR